jgi:urea carboxylase
MCIYGMDSPGGYQLVGRTLPIWNTFVKNAVFKDGEPWLLRFFDQVRFYPVSEAELTDLREAFREGRMTPKIEEEVFDFAQYRAFLAANAADIDAFANTQAAAFETEVALWQAEESVITETEVAQEEAAVLKEGERLVSADLCGNVWKVLVEVGQSVQAGDPLIVVEAMKMELSVSAEFSGTVTAIRCVPGKPVNSGDPLVVIETATEVA